MYSNFPQIVLGFHGCDEEVAEAVINDQKSLLKSENSYDWLGHGVYFWENNPRRALEFAEEMKKLNCFPEPVSGKKTTFSCVYEI